MLFNALNVDRIFGVDSVKEQTALHCIVPALFPRIFHLVRAKLLAEIRNVAFRLAEIRLIAGCDIEPVCSVKKLVIEVA